MLEGEQGSGHRRHAKGKLKVEQPNSPSQIPGSWFWLRAARHLRLNLDSQGPAPTHTLQLDSPPNRRPHLELALMKAAMRWNTPWRSSSSTCSSVRCFTSFTCRSVPICPSRVLLVAAWA